MDAAFEDVGLEEREESDRRVDGASPSVGSPALGPTRSRDRSSGAEREESSEQ